MSASNFHSKKQTKEEKKQKMNESKKGTSWRRTSPLQNADLSSEDDSKVSTLPTQTHQKSLFNWSHFDIMESTYSPNVIGLEHGNQRVDSQESSLCKGNHGLGSVDNGIMLQQGKHGDGTSIDTIDESSSFAMLDRKVSLAPLKISTTDMSSVKNTSQIQIFENSDDHDSDIDSPCWKGTMYLSPTPSKTSGSEKVHHVEKATEKFNRLNPRAPEFIPGIGFIEDDFVLSKSSAPNATAESPLELNKRIVLQASSSTPSKTSGAENVHHVEKTTEKHNRLNPRAPEFIPGIGFVEDDFVHN